MSPGDKTDVANLAQKYKNKFPDVGRKILRRMIRTENPKLFKDNLSSVSNLRKLDRCLKKMFVVPPPSIVDLISTLEAKPKDINKNENHQTVSSEKYYCEKCGEYILERIHTGGSPAVQKIKCSCGFENDISKAYAKDKEESQIKKRKKVKR
jgi:hypothetical protein